MKKLIFSIVIITLVLILPLLSMAADRLTVVASVFPLYEFAREVGGTDADVKMLLPAGVEPHSWEPKPSDIVRVSKADIFLYVSESMEPWAHRIATAVKGKDTVFLEVMNTLEVPSHLESHRSTVPHSGERKDEQDPHFWLDLSLSARAVESIGLVFGRKDPANRDAFASRAKAYAHHLEELDRTFRDGLEHCRTRRFVTGGHSAFGHLARRYDLVQISLYGLSPDSEPTAAHLASVIEKMKENDLGIVFFEEMVNPRLAEVLASETGAGMKILLPAGNITAGRMERGDTFVQIMKENLISLREGLACE
jgi:zinc transport system substrate-binding protein